MVWDVLEMTVRSRLRQYRRSDEHVLQGSRKDWGAVSVSVVDKRRSGRRERFTTSSSRWSFVAKRCELFFDDLLPLSRGLKTACGFNHEGDLS